MSFWGIYCDWCGASDCMCSCLEELQAFNRGRRLEQPPESKPRRHHRWLSFWGPIVLLWVGGVTARFLGASLGTASLIAGASILYACVWLVAISRRLGP